MVPAVKILETARTENADIIGLSGLITPSLDEMVHVASEMEREGFEVPLLIGGATTSKVHTAVKVAPKYHGATIYVTDASRSAKITSGLMSDTLKEDLVRKVADEYAEVRAAYKGRTTGARRYSIAEARSHKFAIDWDETVPPQPAFVGCESFEDCPLEELVERIDWTPFFRTWELAGTYPRIFEDSVIGEAARNLYEDAQALLGRIVGEKLLRARGVVGFYPANSREDDDIEVYVNDSREEVRALIHTLRQQMAKGASRANFALADFVAPKESGIQDYIGGFAVTTGIGVDELAQAFEADHDDYSAIMVKALADRLAEAFAERMHERVRKEFWGYAKEEDLDNAALIREAYQGIRPAPGYPACPDHTEKVTLFALLAAPDMAGITLTESSVMVPAASVSGYYFWHPDSQYFGVGKIDRDQVADYARRKGVELEQAERWLAASLNYEPGSGD